MKTRWIPVLALLALVPATVSAERVSLATLQQQVDQLTTAVKGLDEALARTRAELASAREELAKVQANSVLGLDGVLSIKAVAGRDTAVFEGVNVQLTNGTGMTGALNGLGNLVIGYDVDSSGLADRFGSHNIVLGDEQSYPDTGDVVTGSIVSFRDLALAAAGHMNTTVGNSQQTTVGADQTTVVGASQTVAVGATQTATVGLNQTITIGNDRTEQIGGMSSTSVATDLSWNIGSNMALSIGKIAMLEAGDELILKTGAALQSMKKNGDIVIQGKNVDIKGSGGIGIKASADLTLEGSRILQN